MGASPIAITILVDNQAGPGLTTEHGFSLWIEADGRHILFDTGQGPALPVNARALGVDLRQTDMVVLSHGHYDHTGGIPHVLHVAPNAHVYCHPGVVQPRYSLRNGSPKPAHMPSESMAALDRLPEKNLHWTSEAVMLSENIGLTGPIPRQTTFEDTGGAFFLDPEARHADPIEDDLALWIKTDEGLVVCVGCCHAGIINTLTMSHA
jgi:7,8-dihydropterin-6-yl-methyl-4-(beta-D-ribofuranosyl)aminobenzene 5'-phosphate synthase